MEQAPLLASVVLSADKSREDVEPPGRDDEVRDDGDDRLEGGVGNDIVIGGFGRDTLLGWYGNDVLDGQAGDDLVWVHYDEDTVFGGDGIDQLYNRSPDWGPGRTLRDLRSNLGLQAALPTVGRYA